MASIPIPLNPNPNRPFLTNSKLKPSVKLNKTHRPRSSEDAKDQEKQKLVYKSYLKQLSSLCREGQIEQAVGLLTQMELSHLPIGPEAYTELLQGCVNLRALSTGRQVHARLIKTGEFFSGNEYVETKVLVFYSMCDVPDAAGNLFRRMRVKNVFSWAAIIGLYCRLGSYEEGQLAFCEMIESGVTGDSFVLPNVLKACGAMMSLGFGRGVHGYVEKMGIGGCVFVASSLVDMYGKCRALEDARKMFDEMPERNVVAWNSMIVGCVQNGMNELAIGLFHDMREEGVDPSRVTISSLLSASANLGVVEEGKQGHAISIIGGLELDSILGTSIVNFYTKVGLIWDAEVAFKTLMDKDLVTWNLLISGYVQHGQVPKALDMCHRMRLLHLRFDSVTLASVLSASAKNCDLNRGKEAHCFCIKNNFDNDMVVANSIIDMYASCGRIDFAKIVFDSSIRRDLIMWNTIIGAYAEVGESSEALRLFHQMQLEGISPDVISWNSLISGFLKCGRVNEAKDMFSQMEVSHETKPNLVTWNTLISGLARNGFCEESIWNFLKMQESGVRPNIACLSGALSACTNMASLRLGKSIHGYVVRHNLPSSVHISTSLLDMYAKCGNIMGANRLFDKISSKELPVYNSMISAYAFHGHADEALALYRHLEEEQEDNIEPDEITFTNVLSACSHAGRIKEAVEILDRMVSKHDLQPNLEHYGCVVDLLCRSGNVEEALRITDTMPYEPDSRIFGSLISSCREQGEIELVDYLSERLLELEPESSGNYVAISNAYAVAGGWYEVSKLRELMREKGLRKSPGCSWVQIGSELHGFVAGDWSHENIHELRAILALLDMEIHRVESLLTGFFNSCQRLA
ncbi:pentatricopeptide repeat-containing protein At5g55740, chloroplastic [Punica granatum]|uniref:Uncharacterized protein n=2 Tax=Punica granatum TaxID=22663 RepID=A0A2I0KDV9_PUNGR|nr:pentatricopeptide repeat-containing protein At5g55740, chloroplastic [Punica granatum]PKI66704.1 hypothetical protein CRG98_012899 [Punica granatum]